MCRGQRGRLPHYEAIHLSSYFRRSSVTLIFHCKVQNCCSTFPTHVFGNGIGETASSSIQGGIDAQCSAVQCSGTRSSRRRRRSLMDAPSWTIISVYEDGAMPLQIKGPSLASRIGRVIERCRATQRETSMRKYEEQMGIWK